MKKLLTVLTLSLASASAFASETGNATVRVLSETAKIVKIDITGAAAAALYENLDVVATHSDSGASVKQGKQITCALSYSTIGQMLSPVVQNYSCTMIVGSEGEVESDGDVIIKG